MLVNDVLNIIETNISTLDDLSGKSLNTFFTKRQIVTYLKMALDTYAAQTSAIEGIYSIPLNPILQLVAQPPDILRTHSYRFIVVYVQGRQYGINVENINRVKANFPFDITGIANWILPWGNELSIYPNNANNFYTTTLTSAIKSTDTTLPVASTSNFPPHSGRVTIDNEKIRYKYLDSTNFYGCDRGIESTSAAAHVSGSTINENNLHFWYFKKHFPITVIESNTIDPSVLNQTMEVCDEHIPIITDYVSYRLLRIFDATRAAQYQVDFEKWLEVVKWQIKDGRSKISNAGEIRDAYGFEKNFPYQTAL